MTQKRKTKREGSRHSGIDFQTGRVNGKNAAHQFIGITTMATSLNKVGARESKELENELHGIFDGTPTRAKRAIGKFSAKGAKKEIKTVEF